MNRKITIDFASRRFIVFVFLFTLSILLNRKIPANGTLVLLYAFSNASFEIKTDPAQVDRNSSSSAVCEMSQINCQWESVLWGNAQDNKTVP